MREREAFWAPEQGYFAIQGTKPHTIGYALNDSTAGLAAWIIDKVHVLCDYPGGHQDGTLPEGGLPATSQVGRGALHIVQWTEMPRGGHFAALEEPELYIEDVRKFFGSGG